MAISQIPAALNLASRGYPVFPCSDPSKKPTTPNGFKDASTDPEEVRRLWRDHPGGLIGVATGKVIGLNVLDLDFGRHQEACDWWRENRQRVPRTRTHRTRSGGLHLLFQHDDRVHCTAGKMRLGVDTRGNGGYIIWWPAADLPILSDAPPAPWPDWLLAEFRPKPQPRSRSVVRVPDNHLLAKLVQMVAGAREGERNSLTFWCACRAGEMVAAGVLSATTAIAVIAEAATRSGLPRTEAERTARSGVVTGAPMSEEEDKAKATATVDAMLKGEYGVTIDNFVAYMPGHSYICTLTREMWPGVSVNARVGPVQIGEAPMLDKGGNPVLDEAGNAKTVPIFTKASEWLDQNRPVEQMTWAPGQPMLIADRLVANGGWIKREGVTCFNLYRPPIVLPGDASLATPWIEHVRKIYDGEGDADHIIRYFAFKVQHPEVKINHALMLGGGQGIGKDTICAPLKHAVGPWNFIEISPKHISGRFNGYAKSVFLRVSEARDLGEVNRFDFYEQMKVLTASPPEVLRVDEKHLREYDVFNVCGVIITTNYKTNGIYLPTDDRRHFVAWSTAKKEDFPDEYWNDIWGWYEGGGFAHVAAYLRELDVSDFNPKAPPRKTAAFWDIVNANHAPEEAELADVIDRLSKPHTKLNGEAVMTEDGTPVLVPPEAITIAMIAKVAEGTEIGSWVKDLRNRRIIPHRLEKCGYGQVRNDTAQDGLWKINGARQAVYAHNSLSTREKIEAARNLARMRQ